MTLKAFTHRLDAESVLIWIAITIGVSLRMTDLTVPDFATDEAQAALGASAAWTPLGMQTLLSAQQFFGHEILVARSISALFGIALLPLIYLLARLCTDGRTSLLVTSIAALFPSHILFSRLAYLSIQLCFYWTLTTFAFLKAKENLRPHWLLFLFASSVLATMTKTQGLVLPLFLILGRTIELSIRRKNFKEILKGLFSDPLLWTLAISLIPVSLYILTHPGIAATLSQHSEGGMYGFAGGIHRLTDLLSAWWHVLTLFLIPLLFSLWFLPRLPWPLWTLLSLGALTGFFLGPGHAYYATDLVTFAIPIGIGLRALKTTQRRLCMTGLIATTLLMLSPVSLMKTLWTPYPFSEEPYWNLHAEEINEVLKGQEVVTILGDAGHHLRWYLEPRVLVGKEMQEPFPTEYLLFLKQTAPTEVRGEVLYEDEQVAIIRQEKE